MDLWTGVLHCRFEEFARSARNDLLIVAPFITQKALEAITSATCSGEVTVITTWDPPDIVRGASDLQIYPYVCSRGWELRLHNHLHAKLVIADLRSAILSTANITQLGLGLVEHGNVECALLIECLSLQDRRWILDLVRDSVTVNDELYTSIGSSVKKLQLAADLQWGSGGTSDDGALSTRGVPASRSPQTLVTNVRAIGEYGVQFLEGEALRATLHDVALFSLPLPMLGNLAVLRDEFFRLRVVRSVMDFIGTGRYFGEVKAWLGRNCVDTPTPTRDELRTCTQILFAWIATLGAEKYIVCRPHYSQYLVPVASEGVLVESNRALLSTRGRSICPLNETS